MLQQVRARDSYPALNDFSSGEGSPVVLDVTAGNAYLLKSPDQIVRIGGGSPRSLLDFMSPTQVSAVVNQTLAADVTTAVQNAFNSGESLFGPRGTYRLDGPVSIPIYSDFQGSGVTTLFRAMSDSFAFSFTGDQISVRNFQVDARASQSAGGAFNYSGAGSNIRMSDMFFGSNLFYGLFIAPGVANKGGYFFNTLRWNGVAGCHTGIRIGDDQHSVSDIYFSDVSATASTVADMNTWLDIWNFVDTPVFTDCLFIKATPSSAAITIGTATATQGVTGARFNNVVVDTITGIGVEVGRASDLEFNGLSVQTCTDVGVELAASTEIREVRMRGGVVQGCGKTGIFVFAGPSDVLLDGVMVSNNNTSNTANTHGIRVVNNQHVKVVNCTSGNLTYPPVAGHQKYGLMIDIDTTDYYTVIGNDFSRNETGGLSDGGTGVNKFVSSNL